MQVGRVSALWRFPVKSMLGEAVDYSQVAESGLVGDRAYGLLDPENGKLASSKNPKKWGALFQCKAHFEQQPVVGEPIPPAIIRLPNGKPVSTDSSDIDNILTEAIGRKVRLTSSSPSVPVGTLIEEWWPDDKGPKPYGHVTESGEGWKVTNFPASEAAPPGTFFDVSAIHLMTTSTIEPLQKGSPEQNFDVRRFRPNIVVETEKAKDFVENDWAGVTVEIGEEVKLRGIIPTIRCVMTTLEQEDLPKDPAIMRAVVQHNRLPVYGPKNPLPCAGIFMEVVEGGVIREGDEVRLL